MKLVKIYKIENDYLKRLGKLVGGKRFVLDFKSLEKLK